MVFLIEVIIGFIVFLLAKVVVLKLGGLVIPQLLALLAELQLICLPLLLNLLIYLL
jgi:hypothetical protein